VGNTTKQSKNENHTERVESTVKKGGERILKTHTHTKKRLKKTHVVWQWYRRQTGGQRNPKGKIRKEKGKKVNQQKKRLGEVRAVAE